MTTALDSHRRIRLGEVSPWLAPHGTDQMDFARFDGRQVAIVGEASVWSRIPRLAAHRK